MESAVLFLSPSFNSYSSPTMADIAARVVEEFRKEQNPESDVYYWETEKPRKQAPVHVLNEEDDNGDFEFAFVNKEQNSSPVSADEIFLNGKIKPITNYYPIFNRDLLLASTEKTGTESNSKPLKPAVRRRPLGKLFIEEREPTSCSSSEADELDSVPEESYCVWKPKAAPENCSKSNSTGSSKRWKLREFLLRSNSDGNCNGKDKLVFITGEEKGVTAGKNLSDVKNLSMKEGEKRRSYLPYRQDLLGFFGNVNG